jgi:hypothetical protein
LSNNIDLKDGNLQLAKDVLLALHSAGLDFLGSESSLKKLSEDELLTFLITGHR